MRLLWRAEQLALEAGDLRMVRAGLRLRPMRETVKECLLALNNPGQPHFQSASSARSDEPIAATGPTTSFRNQFTRSPSHRLRVIHRARPAITRVTNAAATVVQACSLTRPIDLDPRVGVVHVGHDRQQFPATATERRRYPQRLDPLADPSSERPHARSLASAPANAIRTVNGITGITSPATARATVKQSRCQADTVRRSLRCTA